MQEEVKEHTREEVQEVNDMAEEVKEATKEEDTKVTKEAGARITRAAGFKVEGVTKDTKEEVKEDMETQRDSREEVKEDIKEEVKERTKDGTRPEATRGIKEEEKEVSCLTASANASNAAVKGISPRTARLALTKWAQGGQRG